MCSCQKCFPFVFTKNRKIWSRISSECSKLFSPTMKDKTIVICDLTLMLNNKNKLFHDDKDGTKSELFMDLMEIIGPVVCLSDFLPPAVSLQGKKMTFRISCVI